ncbi:hypothetical protein [Accumulibacter sp.]|uniref:hypothetical protein n=1 Tax=Accumulibacter sp. TaxID=2053492 RepID=UPI0028C4D52C|nr:hypothetical protein [Accumulibacter sp.]
MTQKYPKILPWVARRAGVRGVKAGGLWMEALRDASDNKGAAPAIVSGTRGDTGRNADICMV